MGICERRMSDGAEKPSSLAINAAKQAIAECTDLNLEHIDMVLFCGIERDQPEPATAHTVQNALGLHAQHVFDVANACFGFVDGIEIASRFIEAGVIRKALITTGEVPTRLIPSFLKQLQGNLSRKEALKLLGWLSVGDAGGAVIMGDGEDERDSAAVSECLTIKPIALTLTSVPTIRKTMGNTRAKWIWAESLPTVSRCIGIYSLKP